MNCFSEGVNHLYTCVLCEQNGRRRGREEVGNDNDGREEEDDDEGAEPKTVGVYKGETSKTIFACHDGHLSKAKAKEKRGE